MSPGCAALLQKAVCDIVQWPNNHSWRLVIRAMAKAVKVNITFAEPSWFCSKISVETLQFDCHKKLVEL